MDQEDLRWSDIRKDYLDLPIPESTNLNVANLGESEGWILTTLPLDHYLVTSVHKAVGSNARDFHDCCESLFRGKGRAVVREFEVENRGDGRRGFVDLAVYGPSGVSGQNEMIGVELDFMRPRKKSLIKLQNYFGSWMVACRLGSPFHGGSK